MNKTVPRDQERVAPELERREALSLLGIGAVSASGGIGILKPDLFVGEPQATGEPVVIEQTITSEETETEYRPASDTVRYPKYKSGDTTIEYSTEPFERWASWKCASVGSEAVLPTVQDRFDQEVSRVGKGVSHEAIGFVIKAHISKPADRDGNGISGPTISKSELIETTPRTIHTTVRLEDREFTRSVPVYVEEVSYRAL